MHLPDEMRAKLTERERTHGGSEKSSPAAIKFGRFSVRLRNFMLVLQFQSKHAQIRESRSCVGK